MDTSAFSDDSAQMSYFENTEHQSLIPDKNKRLSQDAAEPNRIGKNKRNNTHDNQYVLYEIGNAELWYKSQIEVYEKMTLEGKIMWNDLTKREIASVSTLDPLWKNQDMSVRFLTKDVVKREDFDLPSGGLCLVLPLNYARENILPKDININNNGEFIIVPISDVIVVKSKQEGLRDLNLTDIKRKQRHVVIETARTLMLGNMADLNIMQHGDDGFMKLPLKTGHCTQMDLEVKADENKLIIPGSSARLTSIVSDTRDVRSVVNLQVTNTGLAPAFFSVVPRECTPRIAEGFEESSYTNNTLIPPMHTNIFIMELPLEISHDDYRCSIALLNGDGVAVATRDVAIKKNDRCFCVWHCDCVCLGDDPKLICRDMSDVDVLAAGFSPHEGKRRVRSTCYPDDVTINMFIIVIGVLLLLFMFGLLKACIGIILPCVGLMGMECILKIPRKLDQYYESSLRGRPVVYDKEGWPVHPDTKKRTVRLVSKPMEFILNVIMFIILPCILLRDAVMQMINKCKTEEKFRGKFQNTKKCFSSRDSQNVEPRWRRRKGDMRKWMTPQAEALSADIWDYGLSPTGDKKCDCRQPLLNEITRNKEKQQVLHDSEQDDTAYVLTQIQKSKESLKN
ncbi:uncharacterized protein LOC125061892 [Pieris napi]|uniref:uncharacterized protein LOC125061892 n=1 Tax=Pieris napi TaxID=78633 RepID=UPI001FB862D8|nr:uncharacterized protein LOC125061892 [Pieris napi]